MIYLFWIAVAFIIYPYIGYPLYLYIQQRFQPMSIVKGQIQPTVTVVIGARDEECAIAQRVNNLLQQDYPEDKLQIIVVSDGSIDRTVEIVQGFSDSRVHAVPLATNLGKASALNAGVAAAQGEIIVFADARQRFEPDVIQQLVANFADARVGCVSGELFFLKDATSTIQAEIGAYWKYEKWIRKAESATGSVVGATGAIYAIRRRLYQPLPRGTLLDDVLTPMRIVLQGYRTVFDGSAIAYDVVSQDTSQEWKRKVRTLTGNWQLLSLQPVLLIPFANENWFRFISHKVLRLIVPAALVGLLFSSFYLSGFLYRGVLGLQLVSYFTAATGLSLPVARRLRFVNLSCFFVAMNAAVVTGFWRWITGRAASVWQPTCTDTKR